MTIEDRLRTRILRAAVVALVAVSVVTMVSMLAVTARSVGKNTSRIGNLANFMTGLASAHREVMKMEVAGQRDGDEALAQIRIRRELLARQLGVSLGDLVQRDHQNSHLDELNLALAELDAQLVAPSLGTPTVDLREAIMRLELATKHLYDFEGLRYIELTEEVVAGKEHTERVLVALAAMTVLAGTTLIAVLYRVFRSNVRTKAIQLGRALRSLESSQADRARMLNDAIDATERERVWLAAELHDGPVQALSALCYSIDRMDIALQRGNAEPARERMGSTRQELANEVDALRQLMSELRPPALDHGGIDDAVDDYVAAYASRTGITCTTAIDLGIGRNIPLRVETVLYRIAQESMTNVTRHALASNVSVSLHRSSEDEVELVVEDDGVGFSTAQRSGFVKDGHFGLAGMGERAAMVGGRLEVTSMPGRGTRIVARIPVPAEAETLALAVAAAG